MRVDLINQYKAKFLEYLMSYFTQNKVYEEQFKWSVIATWKAHFSMEGKLNEAFAQSLKNDFSGRLWNGEKYSIKSGIIELCSENPLLMRIALEDLFNESKDVDMRINRFLFHCDEAYETLRTKDEKNNNHFQSEYSASLFLSLEYPDKYGLYDYPSFHQFMKMVDSRNIPLEQEKDRYFKSLRALYTIISKDQDFMNGFHFLIRDSGFSGVSLMLINDFIQFTINDKTN